MYVKGPKGIKKCANGTVEYEPDDKGVFNVPDDLGKSLALHHGFKVADGPDIKPETAQDAADKIAADEEEKRLEAVRLHNPDLAPAPVDGEEVPTGEE